MFFCVNEEKKIIFGWSAKCGCTHIKLIFKYLSGLNYNNAHTKDTYKNLKDLDTQNYTIILFVRNPYKRIISGFLEKYNLNGALRSKWNENFDKINFELFVNELTDNKFKIINYHHFTTQTSEAFNLNKINNAKSLKIFDIKSIDYNYIETLFNKKIDESLLNKRGGHERKKFQENYKGKVYNVQMEEYFNYNVEIEQFYNEEIKEKVYNFYKNDFDFLKSHGFNYDIKL